MHVTKVTSENVSDVIRSVKQAPLVGLDTETTSLHPKDGKLRLIQLAVNTPEGPEAYVLDAFKTDPKILLPVFDDTSHIVGHNLGFDLRFLSSVGIDLPSGRNLFDTMIAGQILDCGIIPRKSHALKAMSKEYVGIEVSKEEQTSDWSGTLTLNQVQYAANDAAVLLPLHDRLANRISSEGLQRVMDLEMRCLPGMVWCTLAGMPIDKDAWLTLAKKYREDSEALVYTIADMTGTQDLLGWSWINWRSPAQIQDYYAKERGIVLPDTTDDTLAALRADGDELAALLLTFREKIKRRDTYGDSWAQKFIHADGRVYAEIAQIGAYSGRMASRNPNIQQVPHTKEFRECFRPLPGSKFVISDYSQIELRIMVEMAMDEAGLQAYCVDKADLHTATAKLILGETTKEARQVAKSLNFGLIFGAGSETLRLYAQSAFGVHLSREEATRLRNEWRKIYKGIVKKHRAVEEGVEVIHTLSGRRRIGVDKFTEKLNTPVQGTGADGLKAAIALCYERRNQISSAARPVVYVHDEIVFEAPEDDAEHVAAWLKHNMEEGMSNFLKVVPVVAETALAESWADK